MLLDQRGPGLIPYGSMAQSSQPGVLAAQINRGGDLIMREPSRQGVSHVGGPQVRHGSPRGREQQQQRPSPNTEFQYAPGILSPVSIFPPPHHSIYILHPENPSVRQCLLCGEQMWAERGVGVKFVPMIGVCVGVTLWSPCDVG